MTSQPKTMIASARRVFASIQVTRTLATVGSVNPPPKPRNTGDPWATAFISSGSSTSMRSPLIGWNRTSRAIALVLLVILHRSDPIRSTDQGADASICSRSIRFRSSSAAALRVVAAAAVSAATAARSACSLAADSECSALVRALRASCACQMAAPAPTRAMPAAIHSIMPRTLSGVTL